MVCRCLEYIAAEWRELKPLVSRDGPTLPPPWGVWVRQYEPISPRLTVVDDRSCSLGRVWFLDERGVRERDPWEYARFIVVNWYRPWAVGQSAPQVAIWGPLHEIGLAAFAEYAGGDTIYRETQWGTRFGQGCEMRACLRGGLEIVRTLWRS
jgi:hypothetical protein